jgi:hypothetical protein
MREHIAVQFGKAASSRRKDRALESERSFLHDASLFQTPSGRSALATGGVAEDAEGHPLDGEGRLHARARIRAVRASTMLDLIWIRKGGAV